MIKWILAFGLVICFSGCGRQTANKSETKPDSVVIILPKNIADTFPYFDGNRPTKEGIALGKMLFFDKILSVDSTISCGSCHKPEFGFADGVALSKAGVDKSELARHTPSLINEAFDKTWFWDGGAKNIESFVFGPLTNKHEMGITTAQLEERLNSMPAYVNLFKASFRKIILSKKNGYDSISAALVARALAQYTSSLISFNSRYDKFIRREKGWKLNKEELAGYRLFNQNCSSCHSGELFSDNDYHNLGLDLKLPKLSLNGTEHNIGRARITRLDTDIGKYKTPTVRNLVFTAPYMHDGRFKTLNEVMAFYNKGIKRNINLDAQLINEDDSVGLKLDTADTRKIILFLNTLNDTSFIERHKLK